MRSLLTFLCLILLFLPSINAQNRHHPETDPFAGLDTAFARVLKDWHTAGFAVAVVDRGKVIYAKGFGYRDWDKKAPVTPHTLFAIGSCTKAFTASLIGMLGSKGQLDIDKPVRDYLPELKFYRSSMDDMITLRDMMCHRTGLPRHDLSWYLFGNTSRDSLIRKIQYLEPTAGIREKWQYNNFMFAAQGVVVEKLTGSSWEDNVKNRIFQPLGMNESDLSVREMEKQDDAAVGYGLKNDSIIKRLDYYLIGAMAPAGAINSNVLDMASWVTTWIDGGKFQGKEILPESYVREALSPQMVMPGGMPSKEDPSIYFSSYGFGWMLASYRSHYRVEHGGNIDGFSASTCLFPSDSIGIIVLTNQNASQVPSVVRNLIADRILHLPYKDWNTYLHTIMARAQADAKKAAASKITDHKPGAPATHPPADYAGIYSNPGYGSFEVALQQDSLFAVFPLHTWWLRHSHYDVFDPYDKDPKTGIDTAAGDEGTGILLQFGMDPAGSVTNVSINLEPTLGRPIVFTRSPRTALLSAAELQKYPGEYVLGGTITSKIYIRNGNTLYLFVAGQPEYELVPNGGDKFSIRILSGYSIQFVLDDKGQVTGLLAIQPNGTFKATKKP